MSLSGHELICLNLHPAWSYLRTPSNVSFLMQSNLKQMTIALNVTICSWFSSTMSWLSSISLSENEPHLGSGKVKGWSHSHLLHPTLPLRAPHLSKDSSNSNITGFWAYSWYILHLTCVPKTPSPLTAHLKLTELFLLVPIWYKVRSYPLWNSSTCSPCLCPGLTSQVSRGWVWHPFSGLPKLPPPIACLTHIRGLLLVSVPIFWA